MRTLYNDNIIIQELEMKQRHKKWQVVKINVNETTKVSSETIINSNKNKYKIYK